ncbi:MAG: zinc-dependent alcohol dehydrogenase [Terriglobia bacterium]
MKAAVLEDVGKIVVRAVADPAVRAREALIRVRTVGVCGTDLHLFQGHANYNMDAGGSLIPLKAQPQILGHEFCGEIAEVGREVRDLKAGDRVLCDQGLNCRSQGRFPLCPYCATGDSHQCQFYAEHGITGLQGAMAEYIAMPAVNCVKLADGMTDEQGALVEPVGCVLHSSDRAERAAARYTFEGPERIRNVLICGAGPAGLLFLQVLRNVRRFDGLILVSDLREKNLDLVRRFGGTAINAAHANLADAVREHTQGEGIHYMIESCGSAAIFEQVPAVLRKQGTLLLYGTGHKGRDIGLLANVLYLEPALVAGVGASGGFDPDGRPSIYRRARDLVSKGEIQVLPSVTHRYTALDQIHQAFERDFQRQDYIKGLLTMS